MTHSWTSCRQGPLRTLLPGWALREDTGLIGSLHPKACGLLSLQRGGPTEAHLARELMPAGVPEGSGTSPHGKSPKAAMPRKIKTRPLARSGVQMSPWPECPPGPSLTVPPRTPRPPSTRPASSRALTALGCSPHLPAHPGALWLNSTGTASSPAGHCPLRSAGGSRGLDAGRLGPPVFEHRLPTRWSSQS